MQAYAYEALDRTGRMKKGVVTADSPRAARRDLRGRGLTPVRLTATRNPGGGLSLPGRSPRIAGGDLALVTRQIATMVGAAAPVEEALGTVAAQAEKPAIKTVLMRVRGQVMEGHRLSEALAREPRSFDRLYRAMVAAGEGAGDLGLVLERLAEHLEKTRDMRNKVRTALIYPAALALVALAVIVILMTFVVPRVVEQFEGMGQTLPLLTRIMISISDFLAAYGLWLSGGVVLAGIGFARALNHPAFRGAVDRLVLRLPVIGPLVRDLGAARLARTLATLTASGAPVVDGLKAAARTVTNTVQRDALDRVVTQVQEGKSLPAALKRVDAFPPMVSYMVAAGENSGTLDRMLMKAAETMEATFERVTRTALTLLEPAIIVAMGGIVAVIVLAILMPILQLNAMASL
ncbi:type II secretion system inner membrane protein GspF [Yunchengibacter salinarum]|uniref:type II secretion system inner membrane protein GspF n=1 Tax=Yunchengibacter salinarum TaxID=3133399 RepID=UPI0035B68F71